jgi:PAS domain S-box-containing protein
MRPRLLHKLVDILVQHAGIWLVSVVGLSISTTAFLITQGHFNSQRKIEFQWVAHNRNRLLKQALENVLEPVRLTRDYVQISHNLSDEQFQRAAKPLLARHPGIELIGLILPTGQPQRPLQLSHAASRTDSHFGRDFAIHDRPELRQTLQQAGRSGQMAVSGRIALHQQVENDFGVMAALPYYRNAPARQPPPSRPPDGFVIAMLRLDSLAHQAISYLEPRGVDLLILDESAPGEDRFLEYYASRLQPVSGFRSAAILAHFDQAPVQVREVVRMADRQWSISAMPNDKFRSAEAFQGGAWVVLASGTLLTLLLTVYLLHIKQGSRERSRMGQLLKDREALFWQMTETVDDVFWAISADGSRFLYISPAFETIWGIACDAAYANPGRFVDGIHPQDRHLWHAAVEQARSGSQPVEIFYRVPHDDGPVYWIRDNLFAVTDDTGQVCRLVGVAEDISEKKLAEDALRDSEHKLRTLFNQSPDTIMTVERNGAILLINRGATLQPSGMHERAKDSAKLLPASFREEYRQLLSAAFANGEVSSFPYQSDDASWREIRIVPIVEQHAIRAAMVISTDITEKRNLQAQAIHNARLASIGIMATGVAHDINNPNNAINTAATLFSHIWQDAMPLFREYYREQGDFSLGGLSFAAEGEDLANLISDIKDNSRRIEAIVGNLKHLGRADQGEPGESLQVNSILLAAIRVLGSNIDKYTDQWQLQLAEDLPAVRGNLRQLEQVFINVILNALQSLPDKHHGVHVETALDAQSGMVLIRVMDEGSGIAAGDVPRVTEPFFTTKLSQGGTGLGLYISHSIMKHHRGHMEIRSTEGKGTLITLQLPQIDPEATPGLS